MRLARLELERFGHFEGSKLQLGDAPFVLVHGNNEAGKTTVLESIRWLLFGGSATRYAFEGKLAVAARIELSRGGAVEVRRSKGKLKGTLPTGDDVDEEWIHGQLTKPNRTVFENVFGFSLEGLAQGAKSLEHADLRNVIYGGGLGGVVHPDAILKDIANEREELFVERGQRVLSTLSKRIGELEAKVRSSVMGAHAWKDLEAEREARRTEADLADARRREAREAYEHAKQMCEALDPARRWVSAKRELADFPPALDAAVRAELASLVSGHARYRAACADRDRLSNELEDLQRSVADRLQTLRRGWDLNRLRGLHVDAVARADLEAAIDEENARAREHEQLQRTLRELDDELREPAPEVVEIAPLRALVETCNALAAERKALGNDKTLERKYTTRLARLDPKPTGNLRDVVVPDLDVLEAEDERTRRALARAEDARDAIEVPELGPEGTVPSEAELHAARATRDALFDEVLNDGKKARVYDRAVRAADDLADRMRVHADAVQRRAHRDRQQSAREQAEKLVTEARAARADYERRLVAAWVGVTPRGDMRAWVKERDELFALEDSLEELRVQRDELEKRIAALPGDLAEVRARATETIEHARAAEAIALERRKKEAKRRTLASDLAASDGRAFAERFPRLLVSVGLEPDLSPVAAKTLLNGLILARSDLRREESLRATLASLEDEIKVYEARLHGDIEQLEAQLAREQKRDKLVDQLAEHERTLIRMFGALPDIEALAQRDGAALAGELEALQHALTMLETDVRNRERAVGEIEAKVRSVDGRDDAAEALSELEDQRARLAEHAERYAVLTLANELLSGAIKRFEHQHQPGVLRRASEIFASMTAGRYRSIRKSGEDLVVERADETELGPRQLSTGAGEQLYLAIRLAYVEHYCARAEALPVVLDDVLVNFDEDRAMATLRALSEFSKTTQVILFTCHRRTIALANEAGVGAQTLELAGR